LSTIYNNWNEAAWHVSTSRGT